MSHKLQEATARPAWPQMRMNSCEPSFFFFFNEPAPGFIDLFYWVVSVSISFISALILISSFLLLALGLVVLVLSPVGVRSGGLFEMFFLLVISLYFCSLLS